MKDNPDLIPTADYRDLTRQALRDLRRARANRDDLAIARAEREINGLLDLLTTSARSTA